RSPGWSSCCLSVVVRRLVGDGAVGRVWLAQSARSDADEARLAPQRGDIGHTDVSHSAAEPADELVQDVAYGALVGHASLDAFGHELAGIARLGLEVSVRASLLHRGQRPHAAHGLVAPSLEEEALAGAFLGS